MDNRDLFKRIESEYLNDNYEKVIDLWSQAQDKVEINFKESIDIQLVEAVASSYIHIEHYEDSLVLINRFLDFHENNGSYDKTEGSDYSAFYTLKTEIYYYKKRYLKVYSLIIDYLKSGGIVEVFPKIQIEIEEKISNYAIRFIILCAIMFSIPTFVSLYNFFITGKSIPNNFTSIGVVIPGFLLIFNNLTKRWIVMILRKTYGVV